MGVYKQIGTQNLDFWLVSHFWNAFLIFLSYSDFLHAFIPHNWYRNNQLAATQMPINRMANLGNTHIAQGSVNYSPQASHLFL